MKEILLGWLTKPQIEVSGLEALIGTVECLVVFGILIPCIIIIISKIKNKIESRKKSRSR